MIDRARGTVNMAVADQYRIIDPGSGRQLEKKRPSQQREPETSQDLSDPRVAAQRC